MGSYMLMTIRDREQSDRQREDAGNAKKGTKSTVTNLDTVWKK
jgi:hypothetical protein